MADRTSIRIYEAAGSGDTELLRSSLETHGGFIDAVLPEEWNRTPLHHAAMKRNVPAIEVLAAAGSKAIDIADDSGRMPMHYAAEDEYDELIEKLVRMGSKETALLYPVEQCDRQVQVKVIETLVRLFGSTTNDDDDKKKKAMIDVRDGTGRTALFAAAEAGNDTVIEALIRLGSQAHDLPNSEGRTPMHEAAIAGHVQVVEALVRSGSNPIELVDRDGCRPLHSAARYGQAAVVEALVRLGGSGEGAGINLGNEWGSTPLDDAASGADVAMIEVLVRLGANVNGARYSDGNTALHFAAERGHVTAVSVLVGLGGGEILTRTNHLGRTPLHEAVSNNRVSVVAALLHFICQSVSTGGDGIKAHELVDMQDAQGRTAMHNAACIGSRLLIEMLVGAGSQAVDARTTTGRTPLHIAAQFGQPNVIETLIRLGSQAIDWSDHSADTPLHRAAAARRSYNIEALIRFGARAFDVVGQAGKTPLQIVQQVPSCSSILRACSDNLPTLTQEDEDEVRSIRYRVFFSDSLVHRLIISIC